MPTKQNYPQSFLKCLSLIVVCLFANASHAANPPPNFELTVVESLPENISLDMKLSDIVKAKENSRLQVSKDKIYGVLLENLSPLLNEETFADDYNLMNLATEIPVQKIMDELVFEGADFQAANPADFLAVILPKSPVTYDANSAFPYSNIYASNKAAVIDDAKVGFQPNLSYDDLINLRVLDAVQVAYRHTYLEQQSTGAFFVGALVHIHLAGPQSKIRLQVIGGLPTEQIIPFEQVEKEAKFTQIRSPKTPQFAVNSTDYPGSIIELAYQHQQPVQLKLSFGSLGLINGKDWALTNGLPAFADIVLGTESFGVTSLFRSYNVPNLFGDILQASGTKPVDSFLSKYMNIQMNIHEVEMNVETLEITKMRVTAELSPKEVFSFTEILTMANFKLATASMLANILAMPTFEQPAINQKFIEAGNESLKPYRENIQLLLSQDPVTLLHDPLAQAQFIKVLTDLLSTQTAGAQ